MKIILIFLTCFIALQTVFGQEAIHFDSYGVDDGLLQSTVWDIAQDKNGFLWISTSDGVCKFDGYDFTPCDYLPGGRKSIAGNIHADRKGDIWFNPKFAIEGNQPRCLIFGYESSPSIC